MEKGTNGVCGQRISYQGQEYLAIKVTVITPAGNSEENTKEDTILKKLNNNAYNDLILVQDDTVCFQIIEESVTKWLTNGSALRGEIKQ